MPAATSSLHSAGADAVPIVLSATLYLPEAGMGPFPGLVVAHGASSRRENHEDFCREASAQGFVVLALDFRGHGESEGVADGPLEDDLIAAAGFLRKHPAVDGARLFFRGSSMGGFYGLKAAAAGWFAAVALLCPASEQVMLAGLVNLENRDTEATADGLRRPRADTRPRATSPPPATRWDISKTRKYFLRQDSRAIAARVSCPVLLVHARGDDVVPLSHSLALAGHLAGDATLLALAGGSHTTAQHDPAVHRFTVQWLLDRPATARAGSR
jgi:uncharacterized protein